MKRTRVLLPAALAASLVLAGCGSDDDSTDTSGSAPSDTAPSDDARPDDAETETDDPAEHNAADIAFARDMIPHHEQAVEMADLAAAADAGPEVAELAEEIRAAQAPEIELMSEWLTAWGEPVPGEADGDHDGHDDAADDEGHGGHHDMPGMLDDEQMTELAEATGDDFDRLFLELMVEHHEGAVAMAEEQLDEGVHRPAHDLSEEIIRVQEEEIALMNGLLDD